MVSDRADRRPEAVRFGAAVRRAREAQKLSQDRLAEIAGLSQRYVSELERGKNSPTLTVILQLCQALGISPSALLDEVVREQ